MSAALPKYLPSDSDAQVYTFDRFRLDTAQWTLQRDNETIKLEPKFFDTLLVLVERAGQTVSKQELLLHLWPNTVVEEIGLMRNISKLRTVLEDKPPFRYIETVRKQGYRFCCDVKSESPEYSVTHTAPSEDSVHPAARKTIKTVLTRAALITVGTIILLCLFVLCEQHRTPAKYTFKQLTFNSVELPILHAAPSPNSKILAYSDSTQLYISDANAKERHSLQLPGPFVATNIEWFPDSTHILVSAINLDTGNTGIWRISILGGAAELNVRDARSASAFPDGKRIVFIRKESQVWIANSNGANSYLFATSPPQDKFLERTQVSADNQYIIVLREDAGGLQSAIEAYRVSDGAKVTLYETSAVIQSFCLLDDNQLLVSIVPEDNQLNSQIISMSVALNAGHHSVPYLVADWPGSIATDLSVSTKTKMITAIRNIVSSDAYIADLAADGNSISHSQRLTLNQSINRPAGWLPDNQTILLYSSRLGHYGVYSQAINSSNAHALATDQHDNIRPAVSFDQKWLFYFSTDEQHVAGDLETSLMRLSMNGGQPQLIDTKPDFYRAIRCASRATQCVLEDHTSNERIFVAFDPEHGRGKELLRTQWVRGLTPYNWDISPDGTRIAFIDDAHDPDDIAIFDVRSPSSVTRLHVTTQIPIHTLMWDANGTGFYASAFGLNDLLLKLLHINGNGEIHVLRTAQQSDHGWAIPSPDGKHLLTQQNTQHANIWLLKR